MITWVCHLPIFELTWTRRYKDALEVKVIINVKSTPKHQHRNMPTHQGHSYTPGTHLHTNTGMHLHTQDTPIYQGHTYTPHLNNVYVNRTVCVCSMFLRLKIVFVCVNIWNSVWTKKCVLQYHMWCVDRTVFVCVRVCELKINCMVVWHMCSESVWLVMRGINEPVCVVRTEQCDCGVWTKLCA